jgi:hypothetical protein
MRRISSFMLWVLLGAAVAIIPIACGSSSPNGPDDGASPTDTAHNPDGLTAT